MWPVCQPVLPPFLFLSLHSKEEKSGMKVWRRRDCWARVSWVLCSPLLPIAFLFPFCFLFQAMDWGKSSRSRWLLPQLISWIERGGSCSVACFQDLVFRDACLFWPWRGRLSHRVLYSACKINPLVFSSNVLELYSMFLLSKPHHRNPISFGSKMYLL